MLYLISGGSGSGKSEYAENLAVNKNRDLKNGLYYVATMHPTDDESIERIRRHREKRRYKGFLTVECPFNISAVKSCENDVILIECMSNLLANEMYMTGNIKNMSDIKSEIIEPIKTLSEKNCVIVVTNEVFSDGYDYDSESLKYINFLGYINRELSDFAEGVTEVVCGIPVCIKGELQC